MGIKCVSFTGDYFTEYGNSAYSIDIAIPYYLLSEIIGDPVEDIEALVKESFYDIEIALGEIEGKHSYIVMPVCVTTVDTNPTFDNNTGQDSYEVMRELLEQFFESIDIDIEAMDILNAETNTLLDIDEVTKYLSNKYSVSETDNYIELFLEVCNNKTKKRGL